MPEGDCINLQTGLPVMGWLCLGRVGGTGLFLRPQRKGELLAGKDVEMSISFTQLVPTVLQRAGALLGAPWRRDTALPSQSSCLT